jgi:hypothetical protein
VTGDRKRRIDGHSPTAKDFTEMSRIINPEENVISESPVKRAVLGGGIRAAGEVMRDNLTRENGLLTTKEGSRMEDRPSIRPGTTMRL